MSAGVPDADIDQNYCKVHNLYFRDGECPSCHPEGGKGADSSLVDLDYVDAMIPLMEVAQRIGGQDVEKVILVYRTLKEAL